MSGVQIVYIVRVTSLEQLSVAEFSGEQASVNPIPNSHGRNQPIYERHVTTAGRNRVKEPGFHGEIRLDYFENFYTSKRHFL